MTRGKEKVWREADKISESIKEMQLFVIGFGLQYKVYPQTAKKKLTQRILSTGP